MNVLLVGGPADGRRVVVADKERHYDVVVLLPLNPKLDLTPQPVEYRLHRYNWFPIRVSSPDARHPVTHVTVFAYHELTPTEILEALIDGYRAER